MQLKTLPLDGNDAPARENAQAQDHLRSLVRVAREILHDINNAVTPVSLDTEVMLAEPDLNEPTRQYLERVLRAIDDIGAAITRLDKIAPAREMPTPPVSPEPQTAQRILLVDDDAAILDSLRAVIEMDGHRVTVAESGPAALEAFKTAQHGGTPFDVVITDLGMPSMDGWQLARALKAARPAVQVVMLTGWSERRTTDEAVPEVDYVLTKPPGSDELRQALWHCALRHRDAGEPAKAE